MRYLKTRSLLKLTHCILKVLKKTFDKMKSLVSVTSTRIKVQRYNNTMKLLFLLDNNFEMQKQQYCVFIICSELVF